MCVFFVRLHDILCVAANVGYYCHKPMVSNGAHQLSEQSAESSELRKINKNASTIFTESQHKFADRKNTEKTDRKMLCR